MERLLVRSALARVFFGMALALVATASSAQGVAPAAASSEVRVSGGLFTPSRTDDGITWHSHWVLSPESASDLSGGMTRAIRFAIPLAADESLEPSPGVAPLVVDGHVAGVLVDRAALDGRTVMAIIHQRASFDGEHPKHIGPPVAAGTALQIVDGDLGAGTRLEIETGRTLERRVGHVAPPGISHSAREEARRLTGYDARVTGDPLYIRGDDVRATGLLATVVTARARAQHGATAIAVLFGAVVLGLFGAFRKLRRAASVERADALLAAEVDALDPAPPRGAR